MPTGGHLIPGFGRSRVDAWPAAKNTLVVQGMPSYACPKPKRHAVLTLPARLLRRYRAARCQIAHSPIASTGAELERVTAHASAATSTTVNGLSASSIILLHLSSIQQKPNSRVVEWVSKPLAPCPPGWGPTRSVHSGPWVSEITGETSRLGRGRVIEQPANGLGEPRCLDVPRLRLERRTSSRRRALAESGDGSRGARLSVPPWGRQDTLEV
jgi:hypothetical protein